jgi:hypothetical protein
VAGLAALQGGRFQERSQLRMRTMRQPRSLNFVAERPSHASTGKTGVKTNPRGLPYSEKRFANCN